MKQSNVIDLSARAESIDPLTDLLQQGARQLIEQAVEAELQELLGQYQDQHVDGRAAVVRNGYLPERSVQTGIGPVTVKIPKVSSRRWCRLMCAKRVAWKRPCPGCI